MVKSNAVDDEKTYHTALAHSKFDDLNIRISRGSASPVHFTFG